LINIKINFKKMTNIGHFFLTKFIIIFINIFFIERRYNMIRVSDIMEKEIINVKNGKRMGFITDIDMDINEGKVISFSISGDSGRAFFSRGYEEEAISWNDILKIGCDTIIVNIGSEFNLDEFNI
jgi:sporulation protein, ylmC/ymxH family